MIVNGNLDGKSLSISLKPACLTLSIERIQYADVFSYDYIGRPWTAMIDQVSYRRGLDGRTVAKWLGEGSVRHRRWLSDGESDQVAEFERKTAQVILEACNKNVLSLEPPLSTLAYRQLQTAAAYDRQKRKQDKACYDEIYLPIGILPPDQYGAVVLQATEGCSFNACTFCTFYKDRPFHIKEPVDFALHCQKVLAFLGDGISLRRTVFLGDANALVIPMQRLVKIFEVTQEYFDVAGLGGIYAFLDGMTGEKKTYQDYAELVSLGLQRVYIGLESGSVPLLHYLNKPSMPEAVINTVKAIKKGGAAVGIIVLLGAGGKTYAHEHVKETIKVINKLALDENDILYLSELIESEGMNYQRKAYEDRLIPLPEQERIDQGEQIENGLTFRTHLGMPHISRYDIREFVY